MMFVRLNQKNYYMQYDFSLSLNDLRKRIRAIDPMTTSILEVEFLLRNVMHILEINSARSAISALAHTRDKEGTYMFLAESAAEVSKAVEEVKGHLLRDIPASDYRVDCEPDSLDTPLIRRFSRGGESSNM